MAPRLFHRPGRGVRSSKDVEVKWGIHPLGDKRAQWTADDQRTAMVLLVEGTFRIDLSEGSTTLAKHGDYLVWGPGDRPFMGGAGSLGRHHRQVAIRPSVTRLAPPLGS
jgi:hypothetical protein